ncbi:MAG: hypothetical protein EP343_06000 [Deltaproteobacteria bacterium]|nr:MAG: hypothetical protein EP343_06000 [Deltaproteobacteria bacterium]
MAMAPERVRKVTFFGKEIEVDHSYSVEQIRTALKTMFPQIENAEPEYDEQGNVKFVVRAGTKG